MTESWRAMVVSYFSVLVAVVVAEPPACLDAMKKYQFTHPIAATPATMTSQSIPDMKSSCGKYP
jgi:hypothetical protein